MDEATRRALEERAPCDARFRVHVPGPGEAFHVRWLRTTGRVFFDARGQPKRFDSITLDITAEHQLEESLRQTLQEKNESLQTLERVNTTDQALAAKLHLEKLVQGVTDATMQSSRASFVRCILLQRAQRAGTAAHAVHTRATRVFEPTFQGKGILRSDDITKAPRHGHNPPYHGMPKGHLPARSDLDAPVISRSDDFLFVGNDNAGRNLAGRDSLVFTCEANGVNPRAPTSPTCCCACSPPASRLEELLPGAWVRRFIVGAS